MRVLVTPFLLFTLALNLGLSVSIAVLANEPAMGPEGPQKRRKHQKDKHKKEQGNMVLEFELPTITPGPDMPLARVLELADRQSLTLKSARLEIAKADALLSQAYALVLPGAQASLVFSHNDHADKMNIAKSMSSVLESLGPQFADMLSDGGDMVIRPQEDLKGQVQVGMSLVNAKSWTTIAVAKRGIKAAKFSVEDGRQQLLHGVAQGYYMSLMARELIQLNEEQVRSAAHHLNVSRARYEVGTGLRIDVIRAETDLETSRQALLSSHLAFDNARDAIANIIGTDELPMPVATPPMAMPMGDDDRLVQMAHGSRSDLRAKSAFVELAEKQLDESWMQFLPTLDVGWGFQYQFTKPPELGSPDRSRWSLIFTLAVPIYNQFRYGDLDYKRAALAQASVNREDVERNIAVEVRKARRDYRNAITIVEIAERQAALAKEGLTLVEASYGAGTGSSLDVTDVRERVSMANVNLAAKRLEAQIAILGLLKAVGADMLVPVQSGSGFQPAE